MLLKSNVSSPTRQYVAQCVQPNFDGYYFRTFTLPQKDEYGSKLENSIATASWYFLNRLNFMACIEGVFPLENFQDVQPQKEWGT